MRVEALYRDGHKEPLLVDDQVTLLRVVQLARTLYPSSSIKAIRIVPRDQDRTGKD